jgi:hypothetical protein
MRGGGSVPRATAWRPLGAAVAALVAAACSGAGPGAAPIACPTPGILADAADLTRYAPGATVRDLTTLEFDARLTGLSGGCRVAGRGRGVEMTLNAQFVVDRGPASFTRSLDLPWSIAVLDARTNEPIDRPQRLVDQIRFGPNETRAAVTSQGVSILLPVSENRRVNDYRVLVFLQLTEDELAVNRRRGPR